MPIIENLSALEILDSRGRPTIQATCRFACGAVGTASVPSGASTGAAEALELRDGDSKRYGGLGCRKAVGHINQEINQALSGSEFANQSALDHGLLALDGTDNKGNLGANAILAVSLAFARAFAATQEIPLYSYFAHVLTEISSTKNSGAEGTSVGVETYRNREPQLPRLTVNLFSGGKHAGGQVAIQDVLIVPSSASTVDESLSMVYAVYQSAAKLCQERYGSRSLTADEGGLAPQFGSIDEMLQCAVDAINQAGFKPGVDVALAIDVASSHFYENGRYWIGQDSLTSLEMVDLLSQWVDRYPIVSIEDGLAEEDWQYWPELTQRIAPKALVLGDDFLCTNPRRIRQAISTNAATALLLKVNQIGTLIEAAQAYCLARSAGWLVTVSARSGETEDNWLADLAVGWAGDQIKVGSITQSERLAKYNRLLEIEAADSLSLNSWPIL